ncbi:MAG: hypothetical protein MJ168_04300 [Clostridia bacterium]|nr:hypothetical protein [Clostridia bacterium]
MTGSVAADLTVTTIVSRTDEPILTVAVYVPTELALRVLSHVIVALLSARLSV